ncbi:DNA-binding protein [Flagellimonas aquimarina]|nr:DNA-binding protein [Allomuricauda koreensis]
MKKTLFLIAFAVMGAMALYAQKGDGSANKTSNYGKMFNPKTIETFEASVTSILTIYEAQKSTYGIHLEVKNDQGVIPVHLGPSWYIDDQDVIFSIGDTLSITGSRITYEGTPAIIAMEVKINEVVLPLRNQNGIPNWRGWQKKNARNKRNKSQ